MQKCVALSYTFAMWRAFKVLVLTLVVFCFALGGWLAWVHRPFEKQDWIKAASELEKTGNCHRLKQLLHAVSLDAGDPAARIYEARLKMLGICPKLTRTNEPDTEAIAKSLKSAVRREGFIRHFPARREWTITKGWPYAVQFAARYWDRPHLVFWRTVAWLKCANQDIWTIPVNHVAIDNAVAYYAREERQAPKTRLSRSQQWCGATYYSIALALKTDPDNAVALKNSKGALITAVQMGSHAAALDKILDKPHSPDDRKPLIVMGPLVDLAIRHRYGPAQLVLGKWFLDGYTDLAIPKSLLYAAFWITLANLHEEKELRLLQSVTAQLTESEKHKVSHAVECWYHDPLLPSHLGISTHLLQPRYLESGFIDCKK